MLHDTEVPFFKFGKIFLKLKTILYLGLAKVVECNNIQKDFFNPTWYVVEI